MRCSLSQENSAVEASLQSTIRGSHLRRFLHVTSNEQSCTCKSGRSILRL